MTMTKREMAIASVLTSLGMNPGDYDLLADGVGTTIVDNLITDGLLPLQMAGDPDVASILDHFQMAFRTTTVSRTDRFAASRLAKRNGSATVIYMIQELNKRRTEKYAPTVNNLTDLERKWPSVERFVSNGGERLDA
jgi:hypothetical protein